ncbi:hypothetical protein [Enterococcus alishanensis]|uniref:Uncharacterized protein n=1 Tax=Enterococcus alishanensis TaxID=1303817 RepID=A0ABS6TGQ2_9ENTE|nr:hypothetical protein [Enterococcus alishanensis]MBV7392105.1 hypothetical protein [Enterococcus alishanensis]
MNKLDTTWLLIGISFLLFGFTIEKFYFILAAPFLLIAITDRDSHKDEHENG